MNDEPRPDVPDEITISAPAMQRLADDPELSAAMESAREAGGHVGLVRFLDEHGLTYYAGGADPERAFRDLSGAGLLDIQWTDRAPGAAGAHRPADRRKAARKAQKRARRAGRRR